MDHRNAAAWHSLITQWLELKRARSQSSHTHRSYAAAIRRWQEFLAAQQPPTALWEADASHVRLWQQAMRQAGLSEATTNHRLSCVSSFYSFVQGERRMEGGVERGIFVDAAGKARQNPFRTGNVQRGRTQIYARARVLSRVEVSLLLGHLERQAGTVAGARALALVLTFLYTGWRSAELLRMRWGDLRPSRSQAGAYVYAWQGKGGKRQDDVLPALCHAAICAYLRADGRMGPGRQPAPDEPVWLPVATPRMDGMRGAPAVDGKRPISEATALRALRAALKGAGVGDAGAYRIHDLRHTHAHLLLEAGMDLAAIQQRLHHASLSTTGLYVRTVHREDPVDEVTDAFAQLRLHAESAPDGA